MNRLKRKIFIVLAIAVTAALAILSPGVAWWRCLSYQEWRADSFGKQVYNTYLYNASLLERLAVSNVMATAEDAFSYIGDREWAERQYGKLGFYSIETEYYPDAVTESHELHLVTVHISGDSGFMWVKYSQEAYNVHGERTYGGWNILALWIIQKDDSGAWQVVSYNEPP